MPDVANLSVVDQSMIEPFTALTKNTRFTTNTSSIVQQSRHLTQGPMRSEKVYLMTQLLNEKASQLQNESEFIKS